MTEKFLWDIPKLTKFKEDIFKINVLLTPLLASSNVRLVWTEQESWKLQLRLTKQKGWTTNFWNC